MRSVPLTLLIWQILLDLVVHDTKLIKKTLRLLVPVGGLFTSSCVEHSQKISVHLLCCVLVIRFCKSKFITDIAEHSEYT